MCEVCRGNLLLQEQPNGGSALLWVIKGQGQWLRSNEVDLHYFLGFRFKRPTLFDMPLERMTVGDFKTYTVWRSESLRCCVVLKTFSRKFAKEDIYIEGLKGWVQERLNIKRFVNEYVRALCSKTCHTKVNSHTQVPAPAEVLLVRMEMQRNALTQLTKSPIPMKSWLLGMQGSTA
jgi:hypothetical protein